MKKFFGSIRRKARLSFSPPFDQSESGFQGEGSSSSILTPPNVQGYFIRYKDLGKLHKAASVGDLEKVHHLLSKKHDVDKRDKEHRTPLHLACANGYPDIVSLLVARKCKLNIRDYENSSPLIKAVQCQQEECATILLENKAEPNLMDIHRNTALHYAVRGNNVSLVNKLIEHKANIEAQNKDGHTPLLLAITENNPEMVAILLKKGADVNASDKLQRTALMLAVGGEPIGIVNLLLQYDIDLSCQDIYGLTAEEYAACNGYLIHHELLSQYKIKKNLNKPILPETSCPDRISAVKLSCVSTKIEGVGRLVGVAVTNGNWCQTSEENMCYSQLNSVPSLENQLTQIKGMSINWGMVEQVVAYGYNGILLCYKK